MRHPIGNLCCALILTFALGCERKPEPPKEAAPSAPPSAQAPQALSADMPPLCSDVCKRVPELGCGKIEECGKGCLQMMMLPVCHDEVETFLGCAGRQPADHWKCDQAGPTPELKEVHCATERRALSDCLASSRAP